MQQILDDLNEFIIHRRARLVLPFQARFKICSSLISNSSKNQEFIQEHLIFKQDSRIKKGKISISSNIREFKFQNLDYKQDS